MVNLKIIFNMDGTGVYYMPHEGIMLDALIQWGMTKPGVDYQSISKTDKPDVFELPLKKWDINNWWGYHASSLFPDKIEGESLQFWRKRFRQNRVSMLKVNNIEIGSKTYREYNVPMPLIICNKMIGYAVGYKNEIEKALSRIKFLGKKRAYGKGGVINCEIEEIDEDFSLKKDGQYMRYMPNEKGDRYGRVRPPYWNNYDRILTNWVGDRI